MEKQMTHTFTVSEKQLKELKLLQKAMQNYAIEKGDTREEAEEYYTLEKTFEFVMMLGQNHLIDRQLSNAGWHYKDSYDEGTYPY